MSGNLLIPEGEGLEIDYDWYEKNPRKVHETSLERWEAFANCGIDEWKSCEFQDELLKVINYDTDLAMVIYHFIGKNFDEWLRRKDIPDLGGLSPLECLNTEWGTKRLRMLLMRMH